MFPREIRSLYPWLFGALLWLMLALVVSQEYLRVSEAEHLLEISGLLGLLWMQFGFAGLFHTLRKERGRRAILFLLITLVPPLLLLTNNLVLIR